MEVELQSVKNENEMLNEKIKELEKWLVLLLNNFYEGNPNSLKNIEQVRLRLSLMFFLGIDEDRRIKEGKAAAEEGYATTTALEL